MKRIQPIRFIICAAILFSLVSQNWCESAQTWPFFQPCRPVRTLQVIVHRGAAEGAPENTIPALELAVKLGFEWAEVDVRLSRDGRHVLFHDEQLDNKTDGSGLVADKSLAELQSLDAGIKFAHRFQQTRIPTLKEALAYCKGKINLYLDCKAIQADLLVKEILDAGMENQVAVYDDPASLKTFQHFANGKIPLMAKCQNEAELAELNRSLHPAVIEVDVEDLSETLVRDAHQNGVLVQVKALDQDDNSGVWQKAYDLGVDYVQTDHGDRVQAVYFQNKIGAQRACWISAHRGVSILAPENTHASIQKAIDLACDFAEIDVHTTSDGHFMLMHDSSLNRTTLLRGAVHDFPWSELQAASVGVWFGARYSGELIPVFSDVLQKTQGKIQIYLDNKETEPHRLVEELRRCNAVENVVIYDGDWDELAVIRSLEPKLRLMPRFHTQNEIGALAERLSPFATDMPWELLSKDLIQQCHEKGIKVFSDAMGGHEKIEDYLQAIQWGIDLIQTDNPLLVQRALEIYASQN